MYNTSQNYKDKILNDSTQHELNIYIDNNKIEPNHIIDFKSTLELFNNNEFCLGCTPEIDIEFEIDKRDLPEVYNEVYVETGIDGEVVPIGYFTIQKPIEDDEFKVKIKATDYMKKFEDNKYDGSNLNYPATMLQVLQDICTKIGVELGSTSFLNADKQIAVYDNTVTARTYIGYIAEQAGGFAVIGRDRKLYIKTFGEDTADIDINLFGDFKWGDKFSVSKVSYEDGTQNYKFGDETASTVYINQNNMYIVDSEQIENIYNQIKDFEVYSFEGETIIDPAYDIGDILIIDGKKVIYQGELEYAGKFKANIKSKIQAKTEQESMQTKSNSSEKIRRVQSEINQIDGKIEQLVEETSDQSQKLTKVEQTVDSISQKVSDVEDLTRTAEEIKTVTLENCIEGNLLELHIYGNNTVFDYITLDDELVLSDDLYLKGDSLITTDKDGNKTEYELNVQEPLRQNSEVCDEFVLENGQAKVIRRVNKSGSTKAKESVENLGKLEIPLKEGTNTITINNYTARIKAKYVIKSAYSDTFASRVEMNSAITQNSEKIMSEVNKKVDENELGTKIEQNAEAVKFAWNQISEFIQMMIINGNASLAILEKNKKVLMALDKVGQHFYNSDKTMDIGAFDCYFPSYDTTYKSLMFALNEKATNNFMAWGYKTTAENGDITYTPVVYLGGNSDADYGFHVENDIILNFNKIRLKKSKIYDNNDSLCFEIGEDLFYGDTRDNKEIFSVYNNSTGTKTFRLFGDDNSPIMIDCDGNLVLANGKIILDNNGNIDCVHLYQTGDSSDIRIKNNIKDSSESAINIINKIHHKEFDKKDDNTHYKIGYIAQEMEQIDKNFVVKKHANKEKGVEERYYINQLPILATVTKAIQEQQAQIEELKKEIETLKGAKE